GLAGRFEHYTDFGNTSDYKVTARIEATKQLVFRGAASTGFRAPSLGQSYFSAISTNFLNINGVFTPFDVGHFRVNSPLARALGPGLGGKPGLPGCLRPFREPDHADRPDPSPAGSVPVGPLRPARAAPVDVWTAEGQPAADDGLEERRLGRDRPGQPLRNVL